MNETVLITGASGGFGLEFARIFAKDGYNLVLTARNAERLHDLKAKLMRLHPQIEVATFAQDLAEPDAPQRIYDFTVEQGITVDILINNAGFGDWGKFAGSDWQKQADMIKLNVMAMTHLTHLYLPDMLARGKGRIMNLGSVASFIPGPMMSVYYASKAYVLSFTEALSEETRGTGVRLMALCPGPTDTGFAKTAEFGRKGLFDNKNNLTAAQVAQVGYTKLMKNKVIAIPGTLNSMLPTALRVAPREAVRRIVHWVQS